MIADPRKMVDVRGKLALITGASGAFGAVAARVRAGAGCRLVLAAGKAAALSAIATECRDGGAEVLAVNARPDSEAACADMVAKPVAAFGSLDIYAQLPKITGQGMSAILVGQDVTRALGSAHQFPCLAEGRGSLAGRPGDHSRDAISAACFGT